MHAAGYGHHDQHGEAERTDDEQVFAGAGHLVAAQAAEADQRVTERHAQRRGIRRPALEQGAADASR